jgi:integrase/recombinase XerD
VAFIGKAARRAMRAWLRMRADDNPAMFITRTYDRMTYWGLRSMLTRRARQAGVEPPAAHDFRRAFALNMLRGGVDIFSLQRLMGHTDIGVLRRYLAQNDADLRAAHEKGSPADKI